jgi:NADH:ubiquinone oxidoreductase subunit 2 (subunit N)
MLLYGASLVYGFTGRRRFAGSPRARAGRRPRPVFGLVFLIAGSPSRFGRAVPHVDADVYEGAPTPVTAFFAPPKIAAMALFVARHVTPSRR